MLKQIEHERSLENESYIGAASTYDSEDSRDVEDRLTRAQFSATPDHIMALGALVDRLASCQAASSIFQPLDEDHLGLIDIVFTRDYSNAESLCTDWTETDYKYARDQSWDNSTLQSFNSSDHQASSSIQLPAEDPTARLGQAGNMRKSASSIPGIAPKCGCLAIPRCQSDVNGKELTLSGSQAEFKFVFANESFNSIHEDEPEEFEGGSKTIVYDPACEDTAKTDSLHDGFEVEEADFLEGLAKQHRTQPDDSTALTQDISDTSGTLTETERLDILKDLEQMAISRENVEQDVADLVVGDTFDTQLFKVESIDDNTGEPSFEVEARAISVNNTECSDESLLTEEVQLEFPRKVDKTESTFDSVESTDAKRHKRKWKLKSLRKRLFRVPKATKMQTS